MKALKDGSGVLIMEAWGRGRRDSLSISPWWMIFSWWSTMNYDRNFSSAFLHCFWAVASFLPPPCAIRELSHHFLFLVPHAVVKALHIISQECFQGWCWGSSMSKITQLTFCFGTSKCISGTFLLVDEVDLWLKQHTKKLFLCTQVANMIAKVDNLGLKLEEKLPNNEGLNLRNQGWRKYIIVLMSFVNNVLRAPRGGGE
jgi:hypothetical protein